MGFHGSLGTPLDPPLYYASFLASDCQLKHQTIKAYLSAIRNLQITEGLLDPFKAEAPRLDYVMREVLSTSKVKKV